MKLLFSAAAVCLPVFLFVLAPVVVAEDGSDAPERRTIPELTLNERIVDLLEAIEDESPEIFRRINELPREEALARIMRALDSGVVPVSSVAADTGKTSPAVRGGQIRTYPVLQLTEKHFLYLRFDALTRETADQAQEDLKKKTTRESGGDALNALPAGVIVDLRETDGVQYDRAATVAEAVKRVQPCPVMALVSGKTRGAGEILAAVLRRECGAVLLGTETAGSVFPVKRIFVNEVAWFVPDPPSEYAEISPYALKPDLEKSSEARLSYDELKEAPNKLDGDPVLRLAADLLTLKAAVKPAGQNPAAQ